MRHYFLFALVSALLISFATATHAQPSSNSNKPADPPAKKSKDDLAREFLKVSKAAATERAALAARLEKAKAQLPAGVTPEQIMSQINEDKMIDTLAPIYAKHFTEAELEALIKYYQTPGGKTYADKSEALVQESTAGGEAFGKQIGAYLTEKVRGGNPALPNAPAVEKSKIADKAAKLVKLQKMGEIGKQAADMELEKYAKQGMPANVLAEYKKAMRASELEKIYTAAYAKHLDEAALDEALKFYATPAGKKFMAKTMDLGRETGDAEAKLLESIARGGR